MVIVWVGILLQSFKTHRNWDHEPFVGFEKNSAKIDSCNYDDFEKLIHLHKCEDCKLLIIGFADNSEDTTVSMDRAIAVRDYFVSQGYSAERFEISDGKNRESQICCSQEFEGKMCDLKIKAAENNRVVIFRVL
ncbi:hypothetical protein CRYO30217_01493 [Parvicella tangerina]|uniref:OmpA-like domain-containing protein n=1 Tax=Parvicella tangerina TaxID=2829795 RepID=A0A916JMI6_9FLAO|nr:hypothetical protein CRYO30217_01493 [Parvicella tangerina]